MLEIVIIFTTLFLIAAIPYFLVLFSINDLSMPELDLTKFSPKKGKTKLMAVFPHPDDETMTCGGTLAKYSQDPRFETMVICATRGEEGETNGVVEKENLGKWREQELNNAMVALDIHQHEILDFWDGTLRHKVAELKKSVREKLAKHQPHVVFTFDSSGMYGHPDHITLSNVVTELVVTDFPEIKLIYVTLPKKVLDRIDLPLHMADDPDAVNQTEPTHKVSFWNYRLHKLRAVKAHRSQNLLAAFAGLPPRMMINVMWVEYFSEYRKTKK